MDLITFCMDKMRSINCDVNVYRWRLVYEER